MIWPNRVKGGRRIKNGFDDWEFPVYKIKSYPIISANKKIARVSSHFIRDKGDNKRRLKTIKGL